MFGWLREFIEIRQEARERKARLAEDIQAKAKMCQSCEVLKVALEQEKAEKSQMLKQLLYMTEQSIHPREPERLTAPEPVAVGPRARQIPFAVKRQMLEAEDREQARILREHEENLKRAREDALKAPVSSNIDKLEKELKIGDDNAVSSGQKG